MIWEHDSKSIFLSSLSLVLAMSLTLICFRFSNSLYVLFPVFRINLSRTNCSFTNASAASSPSGSGESIHF